MIAVLTGGTLMGTCEMRLREAVIAGSKDYLFNTLLNPGDILESLGLSADNIP